jgi:hypothetical protein
MGTALLGAKKQLAMAPWRWHQSLPSASSAPSSSLEMAPSVQQLGRIAASVLWRSKSLQSPRSPPVGAPGFLRGSYAHP